MSTASSIPSPESAAPVAAAPTGSPLAGLVEAAQALAQLWITRGRAFGDGDPMATEHCNCCLRGAVAGQIPHAAGCLVGRVLAGVAEQRAQPIPAYAVALIPGRVYVLRFHGYLSQQQHANIAAHLKRNGQGCKFILLDDGLDLVRQAVVPEDGLPAPVESDASREASAALPHIRAAVAAYDAATAADRERRVVCGAEWIIGDASGFFCASTCDARPGHDRDPRSNHWSRERGISWPTAALIARVTELDRWDAGVLR